MTARIKRPPPVPAPCSIYRRELRRLAVSWMKQSTHWYGVGNEERGDIWNEAANMLTSRLDGLEGKR